MKIRLSKLAIDYCRWLAEYYGEAQDEFENHADMQQFSEWALRQVKSGEFEVDRVIAKVICDELDRLVDLGMKKLKYDLNTVELALGYYVPFVESDVFCNGRMRKSKPDLVRDGVKYMWR